MLTKNIDYFQSKPVNIAKITILLDHGYQPQHLRQELEKVYPQIMTKIRFNLAAKPSKSELKMLGKSGERSGGGEVGEASGQMLGWSDAKSWLKTKNRTLANATAKVNLCFIRLMVKRLAASC